MRTTRALHRLAPFAAVVLASCAGNTAPPQTSVQPAPSAAAAPAMPAAASALTQQLDSVMRAAFPADAPGAAVIVVRNGDVLLRSGYGMANLELDVAVGPEHVFRIGSVTKQFTGAAILMLEREGKLSLSDPITRFLPDYPLNGREVTVEHLLGHTSGIRSYTGMAAWRPRWREDLTVAELIEIFQDQPFDFEPGDSWSYNNSGYILLGAIVEQVSGMSYPDFVRTRIFEPLGMTSSHYGGDTPIIPNRVPGYSGGADGVVNTEYLSMTHPYAAGSLLSSVDDLARWDAAISRGELIGAEGWEKAFTPIRLNDGRSTGYGAGWQIGTLGPHGTVEHGGGINGFISHVRRVPEAGIFVAVLANSDQPSANPGEIGLRLAEIALGGIPDVPEVSRTAEQLREYVGVYRISANETRVISLQDGRLTSQRGPGPQFEIRPIGDDLFHFPDSGSRIRFIREGGSIVAMEMQPRVGMVERAVRTDEEPAPPRRTVELPSEAYDAYLGTYQLQPQFEIRITREGDQLYAQATGQSPFPIYPESPTRFFITVTEADLEFEFEGDRVTGLILHQGGRSIPAPRID